MINITDLLQDFTGIEAQGISVQNYIATWGCPREDLQETLHIHLDGQPRLIRLNSSEALEPQLVIYIFVVSSEKDNLIGYLVVGNLHIRTPTTEKTPSFKTRYRLINEATDKIEEILFGGALQPAAGVLLGDLNVTKKQAEEAIRNKQPINGSFEGVWHVHESINGLSGDILLVKGANAQRIDIPIGQSYPTDRGMRNDQHDAFGVQLVIPCSTGSPRRLVMPCDTGVPTKRLKRQ